MNVPVPEYRVPQVSGREFCWLVDCGDIRLGGTGLTNEIKAKKGVVSILFALLQRSVSLSFSSDCNNQRSSFWVGRTQGLSFCCPGLSVMLNRREIAV